MDYSLKFLSAAVISASLAFLTACGGGGGSSSGGGDDPKDEEINVEIDALTPSTYNNKQLCNNPVSANPGVCDIRMYQIMVEAFNNGDDYRNYNVGYGTSDHKGDIQGVIDQLDYIKSAGFNAIWLTPVFQSAELGTVVKPLDATGYFGEDYFTVDPHFGDSKTLHTLIDEAHSRGIYVFLDGVFGHFKDTVRTRADDGSLLYTTKTCQDIGKTYNAGDGTLCANYNVSSTVKFYKDVATYYIKNYQIDGWRLDQAYQVGVENWKAIREAVESAAADVTYTDSEGKTVHPLGYMVGEIWSGDKEVTEYGYGTTATPGLKSNFAFNLRYAIVQALACEEDCAKYNHTGTRILEAITSQEANYPDFAIPNNFLSNHDLVRFGDLIQRAKKLGVISSEDYWKRYRLAHSVIAVMSGPMTVLYGDEWGQEVPDFDVKRDEMGYYDDHVARINGKFSGFSKDQTDLKNYFTKLMGLRDSLKALYMGKMTNVKTDDNLFSVLKTYGDEKVLFFMNVQPHKTLNISFDSSIIDYDTSVYNAVTCEEIVPEGSVYSYKLEPLTSVFLVDSETKTKICD